MYPENTPEMQNPYVLSYPAADYGLYTPPQQQPRQPQVPQATDRREALIRELQANEARIAELTQTLTSLEAGLRSTADSYDMRMAENRARQGDFTNSMWHWARPEQRAQRQINRLNDIDNKISDIDGQISKLRLAKSYENTNRAVADEYDRAIEALERKKSVLMQQNGIRPSFSFNFAKSGKGEDKDLVYRKEALAKFKNSLMTGADGKVYFKPDANRDELLDDLKKIPHWYEDPEVIDLINKVKDTKTVEQSVTENNYQNLLNFVNDPKNFSNGIWEDEARDEFNRLYYSLPKEEKAKGDELLKKYGKKMTKSEYRKYVAAMDKAGSDALESQPIGVKDQIDKGYLNKFTDTKTGLEWVKGQNGKWSAKGWKWR